jgi:8-oxo-dGTP pyrophosphatase MutT (NUDIX family)
MLKTMYCNNCGDQGHVFRACPDPVISCGILFLRGIYEPLGLPVDPATLSVLMVRRKDSMSYMEFVRGKYDTRDTDYIKKMLSNVTVQEQKYILEEPFETLWKRLWGNSRDTDSFEYNVARDKFNSLDLRSLVIPSKFVEPEWGFPKGRRSRGETDLQCAVREFWEETNIPSEAYTVLETTFTENFVATNNIHYKHKYFVAVLKDSKLINLNQKLTPAQKREVSGVEWKSLAECKRITRPHYVDRKRLITELERTVSLGFK